MNDARVLEIDNSPVLSNTLDQPTTRKVIRARD